MALVALDQLVIDPDFYDFLTSVDPNGREEVRVHRAILLPMSDWMICTLQVKLRRCARMFMSENNDIHCEIDMMGANPDALTMDGMGLTVGDKAFVRRAVEKDCFILGL